MRGFRSLETSCGIACVELEGVNATTLRNWLFENREVLTIDVTRRTKELAGIRVSAGLANPKSELDRFVTAFGEARRALGAA